MSTTPGKLFLRNVATEVLNDPLLLPKAAPSAFVGQPPNNRRDYYIIKGLLRMVGMEDANPMMGYVFAARAPPGYVHETRVPQILTGLVIVMLAMFIPTALRLVLRVREERMRFGSDDWAILIASVRL